MQARTILAAVAALLLSAVAAQAITIDTVPVGDPGNAGDTRVMTTDGTSGYGAVAYTYNIGTYEVTASQYTAFLNSVGGVDTYSLYNPNMSNTSSDPGGLGEGFGCGITRSGGGTVSNPYTYTVAANFTNRPVNYVSFWSSCRFANWLTNGQPTGAQGSGTTERGTYAMNGYNGDDGRTIQRILSNSVATWAVTSENEWYKAAYYKGGATNAGYWDYPTSSNIAPGRDMGDASGNNANCYDSGPYPIDNGKYTTVVGQFQNSPSPYGTFDQGGNVMEWTDDAFNYFGSNFACRVTRGGSFEDDGFDTAALLASYRSNSDGFPTSEYENIGFRVSEVGPVPEPLTMVAVGMGIAALGWYTRRRRMAAK